MDPWRLIHPISHCEERSDEAISYFKAVRSEIASSLRSSQ